MKLLSLEFKNIGSYGNRMHRIDFADTTSELIMINGKNGNGKCLDPSTEIEIDFLDEKSKKAILSFINNKRKERKDE